MAIVRKDIPLGNTPEPRFVQDTIKPKVMTYAEKRAAQELVKQKNREARENILNRNANARGMTRAEVQAQQKKDAKKPDAPQEGLINCNKRSDKKGSCTTGQTGGGQSTRDIR